MKVEQTNLNDCWILESNIFEDERGYFYEGFNSQKFKKATGKEFDVKQINQSRSSKGVLRGLHFQKGEKTQAKLVSCIEGEVLDVAIDLRAESSTFGEHAIINLSEHNKKHFYIPKGMAHGFLVLSKYAKLMYLVDELYAKEYDSGIIYNDPDINIRWGVPEKELMLSEKDQKLPLLKNLKLDL